MLLTGNDIKNINLFEDTHRSCHLRSNSKHDASKFTIKMVQTGIGYRIIIKCGCCGSKKDISDYNNW